MRRPPWPLSYTRDVGPRLAAEHLRAAFSAPLSRVASFRAPSHDPFKDENGAADLTRDDLHQQLERLLRPTATQTYAVVVGERGTGKSTAVRKAARAASKDGANGVVYFLIGEAPTVSTDLAKSLHVGREYDARQALLCRLFLRAPPKRALSESSTQKEDFAWQDYNTMVKEAATVFRRKYNRPMTLVLNGGVACTSLP